MSEASSFPIRRQARLSGYDYSLNGAYFTISTHNNEFLLGDIVNDTFVPNRFGVIVVQEWLKTPEIRSEIVLDHFSVMPNHFHAVVFINRGIDGDIRTGDRPVARTRGAGPKTQSIGSLVGGFKPTVTRRINEIRRSPGLPVWRRNYYEHVIRKEADLNRIRGYIENNPARWAEDEENPSRIEK